MFFYSDFIKMTIVSFAACRFFSSFVPFLCLFHLCYRSSAIFRCLVHGAIEGLPDAPEYTSITKYNMWTLHRESLALTVHIAIHMDSHSIPACVAVRRIWEFYLFTMAGIWCVCVGGCVPHRTMIRMQQCTLYFLSFAVCRRTKADYYEYDSGVNKVKCARSAPARTHVSKSRRVHRLAQQKMQIHIGCDSVFGAYFYHSHSIHIVYASRIDRIFGVHAEIFAWLCSCAVRVTRPRGVERMPEKCVCTQWTCRILRRYASASTLFLGM